jgi:ATP-dependent DNA ligase
MLYPQLAQSTTIEDLEPFINDDNWVMEQKLDGHRLLLMSPGRPDMPPTALTRNGTVYSRKLPKAIEEFRFPAGEWALDGELVDGTFYVFDLPIAGLPHGVLWERRAMLEALLDSIQHPFKLVPQAKSVDEKIALASKALASNFEGLILKKTNAPYRSGGRTPEWLKLKFTKSADVVVLDVRDDGKESARLGIVRDGQLIDVGRASLIGKEKRGVIAQGDVVEVMYLYCNNPDVPRLYQPTILRKRDDKRPHECTIDQLQYTNKTVLQDL